MSNISDFVIKNGVLTKYTGPGGDVVIPDGVVKIGDDYENPWSNGRYIGNTSIASVTLPESVTTIGCYAFTWLVNLQEIVLSKNVISVGRGAFGGCSGLKAIRIENPKLKLPSDVFGPASHFSANLLDSVPALCPHLSDGTLKQAILHRKIWPKLSTEAQLEVFVNRQGKALYDAYEKCIQNPELLGKALLKLLTEEQPAKVCNAAAVFICIASKKTISQTLLQQIYEALKVQKNAKKALTIIRENAAAGAKLGIQADKSENISEVEQLVQKELLKQYLYPKDVEAYTQKLYNITAADIPAVEMRDGTTAPAYVILWLLGAHERLSSWAAVSAYDKPDVRPEAQQVLDLLVPQSFQAVLRSLTDAFLELQTLQKKSMLVLPICRYADNDLMLLLTRKVSPLQARWWGFQDGILYSNTRAAMLYADKSNMLDKYADLRGMEEDVIRDVYLSDVGLDASGCKRYDLGNQIVTVKLQQDLSFLIVLPDGKTAKSLPKKDADPEKFDVASADFTDMKKSVKKIVKNRKDQLFTNFLNGRPQGAEHWQQVYLGNPLLRSVANLLVWCQGNATFTLNGTTPITADGEPYIIGTEWIRVAHPMVMKTADLEAWQTYFATHGLKQPFEQIWEPVVDADAVTPDRYKDCMIPFYRFKGREKHGIYVTDEDFHNEIDVRFAECSAAVERIDWERHAINMNHRFQVQSITFDRFTPMVNHILSYLDKCTVYDRILKDDISVVQFLPTFTLAQITEFIKLANENQCHNVMAVLLEYQQKHFATFDPSAEFTLN